jgi:acetolactate synthase I/II/III large subunit
MTDYNVGDLVADFLHASGLGTAFGVVSVHNIPIMDAIGRRNAIRMVPTRGEAGAGHMADAAARATGGLGVCVTSTGPGAANVCGALVEARFAGAAVLHITGQTATGDVDRGRGPVHDVPDQLGMLRSVGKAAYRVRSPETALGTLMRAAAEALTPPRGPVSIEIPIDIQRAPITRPAELDDLALPVPPPAAPSDAALDALAGMLVAARRPLLWTGSGARYARDAVTALLDQGVPVINSWNGRGVVDEAHPLSLGGLGSTPEVIAFYETVDLMVVAGSRLRGHETADLTMKLPARRVQIDVDPEARGRTYASDLFVAADAGETLARLAERVKGRLKLDPGYAAEIAKLKAAAVAAYKAQYLGPYASFPDQARAAMPKGTVLTREATLNSSTWGNRLFPIDDPRNNVHAVGAAIGPSLSFGIGAALASGRKTVAMTGDGGFMLNVSELWTAGQERADVVILVMNDKGYGVIKHIQNRMYGSRNYFADPVQPDMEKLAALAGVGFDRVSSAAEFGPKLAAAIAVDGPVLLEVDMTQVGTFPPYFAPPPYAQKTP